MARDAGGKGGKGGEVQHADDARTFEERVLRSSEPVVVDFWAPWCGPCRAVGPEVAALADEYAGRVRFVKVNVDEAQDVAARYGVRGIPAIALFESGAVTRQVVGARPRQQIAAELGLSRFTAPAPAAPTRASVEERGGGARVGADGRY